MNSVLVCWCVRVSGDYTLPPSNFLKILPCCSSIFSFSLVSLPLGLFLSILFRFFALFPLCLLLCNNLRHVTWVGDLELCRHCFTVIILPALNGQTFFNFILSGHYEASYFKLFTSLHLVVTPWVKTNLLLTS